jgi:hypothetical protein
LPNLIVVFLSDRNFEHHRIEIDRSHPGDLRHDHQSNQKKKIHVLKKPLHPDRQSIRLDAKGKSLNDDDTLKTLSLANNGKLYVKDLGSQISWKMVFLVEYAGPLGVYLWLYTKPWLFYGNPEITTVSLVAKYSSSISSIDRDLISINFQSRGRLLECSLRKENIGNVIRPPLLSCDNAAPKSIQELLLLLALRFVRSLSRQSSSVHATVYSTILLGLRRIRGLYIHIMLMEPTRVKSQRNNELGHF